MVDRAGRPFVLAAALLAAGAASSQPAESPRAEDPATLRAARDALVRAEDFGAALDPAERIVGLAEDELDDAAIADLMGLARIQAELEMHDEAELNYLETIERLRETEGELSAKLVPAYRELARVYIEGRDFTRAVGLLEEARHVSRRDAGLYNLEQSVIIDDMTLAYLGLGDTRAARTLQAERLENAVRRYGENDPRVVPFRSHLADYLERSRLRVSAREQHEKNLAVQEAAYGELDARLLPTLRALVELDFALGEVGDEPMRIERILGSSAGLEARERSELLAVLGDWATVRGAFSEAGSYYSRAYVALAEADTAASEEAFAEPRVLDFVAPLNNVDRGTRNRPYAWGKITLELDVSAAGHAAHVELSSMEPATRLAPDYVRRLRETHFRPRLVDGVPAATRGIRFSHDFRYYVSREDD